MAETLTSETQQPAPVPRLLVELPSRRLMFLENLRELVSPQLLPPLELKSAPAPFWPDVFVKQGIPWRRFADSGVCHVIACALIIGIGRLIALQPHAVVRPALDHTQVIYYSAAEYLPPIERVHCALPSRENPIRHWHDSRLFLCRARLTMDRRRSLLRPASN